MATQLELHDEGHGYDVFGLHPATLERMLGFAGRAFDAYFRPRSHGVEHVPRAGAAILVANHGGVLPIDAAMLCVDVFRQTGRPLRPIADHFVPMLPIVSTMLARVGAVTGTRSNVDCLLARGELIAIWPEGTTAIAKPYRARYQLQDWRVGHAELALRHHVPIVPVAILGADEAWPALARLHVRPFGIPFLPLPATPFPLPVRHDLVYGEPIDLGDGDADDPAVVAHAAMRVRLALGDLLHDALAERRAS